MEAPLPDAANAPDPPVLGTGAGIALRLYLPPAVHPDPLFRVAEDDTLEGGIESAGVLPDVITGILTLLEADGLVKAQDVCPVRLPPARGGNDRGTGALRNDREALDRTCRVPEEIMSQQSVYMGACL